MILASCFASAATKPTELLVRHSLLPGFCPLPPPPLVTPPPPPPFPHPCRLTCTVDWTIKCLDTSLCDTGSRAPRMEKERCHLLRIQNYQSVLSSKPDTCHSVAFQASPTAKTLVLSCLRFGVYSTHFPQSCCHEQRSVT